MTFCGIMRVPTCFAGPVYLQEDGQGPRATSSHTHQKVDAEVTRMLREAYSRVTSLLVSITLPDVETCSPTCMS